MSVLGSQLPQFLLVCPRCVGVGGNHGQLQRNLDGVFFCSDPGVNSFAEEGSCPKTPFPNGGALRYASVRGQDLLASLKYPN